MKFNITGKISFYVDFDIEAESETAAIKEATERIKDYYRLNVSNAMHSYAGTPDIDIDAEENT
jgi:hypothetical protein